MFDSRRPYDQLNELQTLHEAVHCLDCRRNLGVREGRIFHAFPGVAVKLRLDGMFVSGLVVDFKRDTWLRLDEPKLLSFERKLDVMCGCGEVRTVRIPK